MWLSPATSLPLPAACILLLIACDWFRDACGCLSIPLPAAFSTVSLHWDLCTHWLSLAISLHSILTPALSSRHEFLSQHLDFPYAMGLPSRLCICHRFYLCVILHGVYYDLFSAQAKFFCLIHPDWFREFVHRESVGRVLDCTSFTLSASVWFSLTALLNWLKKLRSVYSIWALSLSRYVYGSTSLTCPFSDKIKLRTNWV